MQDGEPYADLFVRGEPVGRELSGHWRTAIEYRLAELGYALNPRVEIRAVPRSIRVDRLAIYTSEVLFVAAAAVCKGRFTPEFLTTLPQELLSQVAGRPEDAPAYPVTPDSLRRYLPADAITWLCDRYGWTRGEHGWQGGFLPGQIIAFNRGICSPERLLHRRGVVCMDTAGGKTLIAILQILALSYSKERRPKRVVVLSPTRELGLEWAALLKSICGAPEKAGGLRICYSDAEHRVQDWEIWRGEYDVAVMVNEKFRWFAQSEGFLAKVGKLVVDEFSTLGEPERGPGLEVAIASALWAHDRLSVLCLTRPTDSLPALLFERDGQPGFTIQVAGRPQAIHVGLWDPQTRTVQWANSNTGERWQEYLDLGYPDLRRAFPRLLRRFVQQSPEEAASGIQNNLLVPLPTKPTNIGVCALLASLYESDPEVAGIIDSNAADTELIRGRLFGLEPTGRRSLLERVLPLGIGLHDADMTTEERRVVSQAFRARELPVLCCTPTLRQGVNTPARTAVFMEWGIAPMSPDGEPRPPYYQALGLTQEFHAFAGRVGRNDPSALRPPIALYLSRGGPGSKEYDTMLRVITHSRAKFRCHLADPGVSFDGPLLSAILTIRNTSGRPPTFAEIQAFFDLTPSAATASGEILPEKALHSLMCLGGFTHLPALEHLRERVAGTRAGTAVEWSAEQIGACFRDCGELQRALPASAGSARTEFQRLADRLARAVAPAAGGAMETLRALCRGETPADLVGIGACTIPTDLLSRLRWFLEEPGLAALVLQPGEGSGAITLTDRQGEPAFDLSVDSTIAAAHGVSVSTCAHFRTWLQNAAAHPGDAWDVLDILALVVLSPDGERIKPLRIATARCGHFGEWFAEHLAAAAARLGEGWRERSPLVAASFDNARQMGTLLALRDWIDGEPFVGAEMGIELLYGIQAHAGSLYELARHVSRVLRVLAEVAASFPEGTWGETRPADLAPLTTGVVSVPHDLEALADATLHGMPHDAAPLAHTKIEGFARAWILALYEYAKGRDTDLPVLERVQTVVADENDQGWHEALPTPGLVSRVREAFTEDRRKPLAEALRLEPALIARFYQHPFIRKAHLAQGRDGRYTALFRLHRDLCVVPWRNAGGQPITVTTAAEYAEWLRLGAVEFLAETGKPFGGRDDYRVDRLFVDLDPEHGYPLSSLRRVVRAVLRRLRAHEWVDAERVTVRFTGGSGFHILAPFRGGAWRPVEQMQAAAMHLLKPLCDDVSIFIGPQPRLAEPHVQIDPSMWRRRAMPRNTFSLNSYTGRVSVAVEPSRIDQFDPEREAALPFVFGILDHLGEEIPEDKMDGTPYEDLLAVYYRCSRQAVRAGGIADTLREDPPAGVPGRLLIHAAAE